MSETIVALSTGALPSGVAIIRISGPETRGLLEELTGPLPWARRLALRSIGETDRGLVAWFPAPHSFTGEDCAELHVHGSRAVVRGLLRRLTSVPGVRLAAAGEFTRRAFENGKLDLTEVQGLGDLLASDTENQRAIAYARLEGGLSRQVEGWRERLLDLRAELEAQLDFSDEDDVGSLPLEFVPAIHSLRSDIVRVAESQSQGRILREGFRVVLAGAPNVGKSSLLNALSRSDVAIVSDEEGTTRDLKEVALDVDGQLVLLVDSAGIRAASSKAERIGVDRARAAMANADLVLWLEAPDVEIGDPSTLHVSANEHADGPPLVRVGTKCDLGAVSGVEISVSAATGDGVAALLNRVLDISGTRSINPASVLVSHEADRIALLTACSALRDAASDVGAPELAAENLRRASASLERLLGKMDAEAVLGRLFQSFCIGK